MSKKTVVEMSKRYRTRDGLPVRILATDAVGGNPVIALVKDEGGEEHLAQYNQYGVCLDPQASWYDLVEVPEEITIKRWVNVYYGHTISIPHKSKDNADRDAFDDRIACVPITVTFKGGEGLDD